jgi:excisionase family DNA binding protein
MNTNPLLTIRQTAAFIGCTYAFVAKAIKTGRLNANKLSRKMVRISHEDIAAFLDAGRTIKR